jgi:hypothetical protein
VFQRGGFGGRWFVVRGRRVVCRETETGGVMREEFLLRELLFCAEFGVLGDEAVRGELADHTLCPPV